MVFKIFLVAIFLISLCSYTTLAIDCSLVRCAQPVCPVYYHSVIPKGSCCGRCEPCKAVACTMEMKYCKEGEVPTGCCPCHIPPKPDCSKIACAAVVRYCKDGELPAGCCPCTPKQDDCSGVFCTMQIKYCTPGELPAGCCPCTMPETQ